MEGIESSSDREVCNTEETRIDGFVSKRKIAVIAEPRQT